MISRRRAIPRSMTGIGKPKYMLGALRLTALLLLAGAVSSGCTAQPRSPEPAYSPARAKAKPLLNLRRQPGGVTEPGHPANVWNIQISSDGSALLSAEGTPLISDGDYESVLPGAALNEIVGLVEQLHSVPQPRLALCMHQDHFEVAEMQSDFFRNECISRIVGSNLEKVYQAAQDLIRGTPWRFLRARSAL